MLLMLLSNPIKVIKFEFRQGNSDNKGSITIAKLQFWLDYKTIVTQGINLEFKLNTERCMDTSSRSI